MRILVVDPNTNAPMTDIGAWLKREMGFTAIVGVVAAMKLIESLVNLAIKTSKAGAHAAPQAKTCFGQSERCNPRRT